MGVITKQTGRNIASQWVLHIINIVANLFLISYVIGKFGAEQYGGWTVVTSIIGYVCMLDAGMGVAMQHYVARFSAKQDQASLVSVFSSSYVIYGLGAVIALLVCLWLSFVYPAVFPKVPDLAAHQCSLALRWIAVSMFIFMINMPIQGTLLGLQRYDVRNLIEIISLITRVAATVVPLNILTPSLAYLGSAFFISVCVRFLLCKMALWRIKPELQFRLSMIKKDALAQIFTYSGHSLIWTICTVIVRDSAPIVATVIVGPEASTFWYVGNRLCVVLGGIIMGAGQVFIPLASSLYASEKWDGLRIVLIRSTRFCALFSLSGAVALIVFGQDILNFWMGPGYTISYYVLVITTLGWVVSWIFSGAVSILMGMRKVRALTIFTLIRLLTCMSLTVAMAYIWGIVGLTIGLMTPLAVTGVLLIPYFVSKYCRIKLHTFFISTLPVPLGISLMVLVCILFMRAIWPAVNIGIFVAEAVIALIIFGILALLFGLDSTSRDILLVKLRIKQPQ